MIGSRLGPYEITGKLGEGGMGEVWRAADPKLRRDVAIKVLPEAFTADADRLARFEREAQALAQLQHPNIASIYGYEESEGLLALVMELVDGAGLDERIAEGALDLDESLTIAHQIAEALEAAHEKGIVHRDLKPQNIKLTPDGQVKVLDFGLAKAMDPAGTASGPDSASRLAASPTLTLNATVQGVLLGTAGYMAPEQAKGVAVDKRADIWAFGVVLWEMLTRRRLFEGDSVPETLAGVLKSEIDLDALPPEVPGAIRRLLRRCLERDRKNRLHDIADARIVLAEVLSGEIHEGASAGAPPVPQPRWRQALPWGVAVLAVGAAGLALLFPSRAPSPARVLWSDLGPPTGQRFHFQGDFGAPPVLSPDGEQVVFGAVDADGTTRLWLRSLSTGKARTLEGTDGGFAPFFSPDGSQIGFFAGDKLKTVSTRGGSPLTIADATNGRGGAWFPDGTIVYSPDFRAGLFRISATGGTPEVFTSLDPQRHSSHRWPMATPDGLGLVYLATSHSWIEQEENELRWIRLDGTGDRTLLSSSANGVASGGKLFHFRESTLFAQPFDASTGSLSGESRVIEQGVLYDQSTWRASYSVASGRLVYSPAGATAGSHLSRFDRTGNLIEELAPEGLFFDLSLSPDGRRLVVSRGVPTDLWLLDLDSLVFGRLTFDAGDEYGGRWSPDGRWIYYVSADAERRQWIHRRSPEGGANAERVFEVESGMDAVLHEVSPDGRRLLVRIADFPHEEHPLLGIIDLDAGAQLVSLAEGPDLSSSSGTFSPDGRWLAYTSAESGISQIYVRPATAEGTSRWQISADGGLLPLWSDDGSEIVYLEPSLNLSRVAITEDGADGLRFGPPEPLFGTTLLADQLAFAVSADGQSLILNHFGEAQSQPLRLVDGWPRLLVP